MSEINEKYLDVIDLITENTETNLSSFREGLTEEKADIIINKFIDAIDSTKKLRKMFLDRNERIFGTKHALKLIPNINLKSIILSLNKENTIKIWNYIQLIYALNRTGTKDCKKYINKLICKIESENEKLIEIKNESKPSEPETKPEEPETNISKTDNMILDMADQLKGSLLNSSGENSFQNMIKTSQKIAEKYAKDFKDGNVSLNDMFKSLGNMMGKIQESTPDREVDMKNMPKPDELLKSFGLGNMNAEKMVDDIKGGNFNPMDMISKMMGGVEKKTEKLTPEQLDEMNNFYANLKTDDLEGLEPIKDEEGGNPLGDIGKTLLSGLAGGNSGDNPLGGIGNLLNNLTNPKND